MTTKAQGITLPFNAGYKNALDSNTGIKGNGLTDDTAAIQNLLNTYSNIFFPPDKEYIISARLTGKSNQSILGGSRDTATLKYTGTSTIPNGDFLAFLGCDNFSVKELAFRSASAKSSNSSKFLHLQDCVYFDVDGITMGATSSSGNNNLTGIQIDQLSSGFVPPRGCGTLQNILYVVEPTDSGGASSVGVYIKGHIFQPIIHVRLLGEGNIEHAKYGIKLENVNNSMIGNWQMRGSTSTEIALINSSSNTIIAPQLVPPPTVGIGIDIDASCFDNTIINPGFNVSSGAPLALIRDQGPVSNRNNILAQSAVGALTPLNKLNGPYQFWKPDGLGPNVVIKRTTTDTESGLVIKSDSNELAKASLVINRGSGPAGQDILRLEGGTALFTRVSSSGEIYIYSPNSVPADSELAVNQCVFYLDQAANKIKVKTKYSTGAVKIGEIPVV